jgi:hypothetical protein
MTRLSTRTKDRLSRLLVEYWSESSFRHNGEPYDRDSWEAGYTSGRLMGMEFALRALFGPSEKHKWYELDSELQGPIDTLLEGSAVYTTVNYPTKKALKEAVKLGQDVRLFAPGLGTPKTDGTETVEGPWYPQPHRWYAEVEVKDGRVVKVK